MNAIDFASVIIDGLRLCYHHTGSSDIPLLLLHGGGADNARLSWHEVMALWQDDRRLIALDLPNYGASDSVDTVHSLEFFCGVVLAFLDKLGIDKVHLCGLSMGGAIALHIALHHAHRIDKLILIAPWGISPDIPYKCIGKWFASSRLNQWSYQLMQYRPLARWTIAHTLIDDNDKITDTLIKDVQQATCRQASIAAFASFQADEIAKIGTGASLYSQLANVNTPTLLIQGDKDQGVKLQHAISAASTLPNAELVIFNNHKHWPQKQSPEQFIQVAKAFLDTP